ncbi:MAG: (Fe-S)-binding protein, partial [Oscillospiraceae bacterium]|nr:(Fe-S)-binding protein [Oscillospiraceae bacterium]
PIHQYFGFDAYSGQGYLNIAKELLTGRITVSKELGEMVYTCTACGACDVNCKSVRDMEVLDTILALREVCAESGCIPEALTQQAQNVENCHNIYGMAHSERFAWLPDDYTDDENADTVLFVGCSAYKHPEIALAAIKILRAGGVKFKLLHEDEWCCGASLWRTGQNEKAKELIQRNVDTFRAHGVKRIITACAECFGSFRAGYPRFVETNFETVHISEIALELIESGKLHFREDSEKLCVTYHDPCMLGRLSEPYVHWEGVIHPFGLHEPPKQWRRGENGVYNAPRDVLHAAGIEIREMTRNYENAFCCGADAKLVDSEFAQWNAEERIREAFSTGAQAIVSSCPKCQESLSAGEMPYIDFAVLLAQML